MSEVGRTTGTYIN